MPVHWLLLFCSALEPFHAPAQTSGTLQVKLHPTEAVSPGSPTRVSFGMPFPRGSVPLAQLNRVRLLRAGLEVPAHIALLSPWRHFSNPAFDGQHARVVLIQFDHTFTLPFPNSEEVTVEWGLQERSTAQQSYTPPRQHWHLVTDGVTATNGFTFGASHGVHEPDVYAVLPAAWLAHAGLKNRMLPLHPEVGPLRLDPYSVPASYPGYREMDQAQVNFFYTVINEDDDLNPYNGSGQVILQNTNIFPLPTEPDSFEPWLYDRPMAFYIGYLRSGQFRFLREAVRNAEYYRSQLYTPDDCSDGPCVGSFKLKNPDANSSWHDSKYSYNECLAMSYWLTGDADMLPHIQQVTRVHDGTPTQVNPTSFTERHAGLKLLAAIVHYEISGDAAARTNAQTIIGHFRNGQTSPYGGLQDGGIWHSIDAHEGNGQSDPITSPWMSALLVDAALRVYLMSEDQETARLIAGLGDHVSGRGSYWTTIRDGENGLADQSGDEPLVFPHYLATHDGLGWASEFNPYGDFDHAPEVACIAAWGAYFHVMLGEGASVPDVLAKAQELHLTFSHATTYWTRPAAPASAGYDAYRVLPARKYAWWYKNSSGLAWALEAASNASNPIAQDFPRWRLLPLCGSSFASILDFVERVNGSCGSLAGKSFAAKSK
jgi:hypothetical protein